MNVYTCTSFDGHWPVGTAAVVLAHSRGHAAGLLMEALETALLRQDIMPADMELFAVGIPDDIMAYARILCDGDY